MSLEERLDSLALNLEMLKKDLDLVRGRIARRAEKLQSLRSCTYALATGTLELRDDSSALHLGARRARVRLESMQRARPPRVAQAERTQSRAPGQAAEWDSAVYSPMTAVPAEAKPARRSKSAARASPVAPVDLSDSV